MLHPSCGELSASTTHHDTKLDQQLEQICPTRPAWTRVLVVIAPAGHAGCAWAVLRQCRNGQAAFGIAGGAGAQVRRDVPDVADGNDLEPAVGLDADPGDAGVAHRHL